MGRTMMHLMVLLQQHACLSYFASGEDIIDAVEREVFEETGVTATFKSVIAVRQAHGFAFGKSDLFFCCGLVLDDDQPISPRHLRPCVRVLMSLPGCSADHGIRPATLLGLLHHATTTQPPQVCTDCRLYQWTQHHILRKQRAFFIG